MTPNVRRLCLDAIGIALFVAISMCMRVPVFENYYLCLGYIIMAIYCYSIGTLDGITVGVLGTILYCVLTAGLRGMPGWAAGNIVIGIIVGSTCRLARKLKNQYLQLLVYIVAVLVSVALGILLVKSAIEMLLYAQPIWLRITNNIYAFVADVAVLLMALPICRVVDARVKREWYRQGK